jgi:cyclophilin family peptidyl-prolyl cis-trans isomerase
LPAVPTDKRERQRAGREARRAAARAAQQRAQRRRQIISIVALVAVVGSIAVFISLSGGNTDDNVDAGAKPSTTTTAEGSTTSTAAATPGTAECPPAEGAAEPKKSFDGAPKDCLTPGATYTADVETDLGKFVIQLDAEKAPKTVNSFVFLSRYKAYEGAPFHRVIPGFVVQGGDVEKGDGTGGPGYEFADELPKQGEYKVGSVAMANSGPNTNGSQFFVVTGDQGASRPPNYSLFGEVTSGMDVVKKIEADGDPSGTPKVVHKIVKVTITEKKG